MKRLSILGLLLVFSLFSFAQTSLPPEKEVSQPAPSAEGTPSQIMDTLAHKREHTQALLTALASLKTPEQKLAYLEKTPSFTKHIQTYREIPSWYAKASVQQKLAVVSLMAIDQFQSLFAGFEALPNKVEKLDQLIRSLVEMDAFYEPIGGIIGYQNTILRLFLTRDTPPDPTQFCIPPYTDIRQKNAETWALAYEGVKRLNETGQLLVVGGAGDRLNLIDDTTKEPLPAACLIFDGKTLFEGLMRDITAQEYFHYRVFGSQISVPILIMTSNAKDNNKHITEMGEKAHWYGHRVDYIRSIVQDQVPMVSLDGQWIVSSPLSLDLRPGGHGIVWKLAKDRGAFEWLKNFGAENLFVRQVNNPLVGLDSTLPTFLGYGLSHHKAFGFASVPSRPGLSEGLNILSFKPDNTAAISNIEYTQFSLLKKLKPDLFKEGACPANTNILFAHVPSIEKALLRNSFPGTLVNVKATPEALKNLHAKQTAARLECSMQNIADELSSPASSHTTPNKDALDTFLVLQDREKFMSVAKKAYAPSQSPAETPESCFYDWTNAMRHLLKNYCHFTLPQEQTLEEYLKEGPSCTFSFHPCLGPFWEVIGQKIHNGFIAPHSDLTLDIAEISCHNLSLFGSFSLKALAPTGQCKKDGETLFSNNVGRALLENVTVQNKGYASRTASEALKHSTKPEEQLEIILEGFSEIVAKNVTIKGPLYIFVPDGQRATISSLPSGQVDVSFELITKPSWVNTISWKPGSPPKLQKKDL